MYQPDLPAAKPILITGGSSGIGKAMGRRIVEPGGGIVVCGRRE